MTICVSRTFSGAIGLYRSDCAPYPALGQDHLNRASWRQNGKDVGIKCTVTVIHGNSTQQCAVHNIIVIPHRNSGRELYMVAGDREHD
jgi:hypothetical protein